MIEERRFDKDQPEEEKKAPQIEIEVIEEEKSGQSLSSVQDSGKSGQKAEKRSFNREFKEALLIKELSRPDEEQEEEKEDPSPVSAFSLRVPDLDSINRSIQDYEEEKKADLNNGLSKN